MSLMDDNFGDEVTAVLERVTDGFFALNSDWEFTYVNEQAEQLLGRENSDLVGTNVWDAFPNAVDSTFYEEYHRAMDTQESVTFDAAFDPLGAHFEVRAYPSETGLSVYFRDVSEHHEREQRLEQYRATLAAIGDGAYAVDADRRYVFVNDAFTEMAGYDRDELLGERETRVLGQDVYHEIGEQIQTLLDGEREVGVVEAKLDPADGDPFWTETRFQLRPGPEEFNGTVGIVRDITERRQRQERLETHRDKLAALVDRTEVIQEVNHRIASAASREDVTETVCRTLTESPFYDVAWIGDRIDGRLTFRAGAGASESDIRALVEAARAEGQAADIETALRRETVHVTQNLEGGGPWSDALAGLGLHSSISLPLVHEGTSFGVLTISADETHAFGGTERDLLASLADTIAYALHTVRDRERYQSVVTDVLDSAVDAGVVIVDDADRVAWCNERAGTFFGFDPAALVGQPRSAFVERYLRPAVEDPTNVAVRRPRDPSEGSGPDELHLTGSGIDERYVERRRTPIESGLYAGGGVEFFYDITTRKESERALAESERLRRTLISNLPGMVYQRENESGWPLTFASDGCRELTGYDPAAFEQGSAAWGADVVHPDDHERVRSEREAAVSAGESFELTYRIVRADGEERWVWETGQYVETTQGTERLEGFVSDVTDRKQQEAELERQHTLRTKILDASPIGILVVDDEGSETIANDRAREMLSSFGYSFDSDGIHIDDIDDEGIELHDGDGNRISTGADPISRALSTGESVSNATVEIRRPDGDNRWVSISTAPIESSDGIDGVGVVTVFEDVTERRRRQTLLERLNHLNTIVRRINTTLVQAPDRETIQETVCSELAGTDQYAAAWYAEVDFAQDELRATAGSGVDIDSLDATSASAEDTFASRALRTGSVPVGPADSEAQRELVDQSACHSESAVIAAIPIAYANSKYGVLCVCSSDESAFSEDVVEVFEELGQTIGHAFNAHLRKEGLVSETATKLEFRLRDFPSEGFELSDKSAGQDPEFTFEETVPRGDGTVIQYVTTQGVSRESFEEIAGAVSTVETVREISSHDGTTRYELRQSNPPMVETLASHGGRVSSISIEDGDLYVVAELPDSVAIREVVEQVFEQYPTADLEAQRSVSQSGSTSVERREELLTELTDRQRTTLEVAYHAGYFAWPRETTGEEVADSLDVSQSTFSQHLRAGERKTYRLLFDGE